MPRKYVRKVGVSRGQWTEENLRLAIEKVKKGEISKHEAERVYSIPIRTLTRRMQSGNTSKSGLGPSASIGVDNEKRLANYIKRLAAAGFAPTRDSIRTLAYNFAEKLEIKHKFSKEKGKAGSQWLQSFLERNKDISVRQAEGLSTARAQGMDRDRVNDFFQHLEKEMIDHGLMDKPGNIFNVDESGIQLINKPGKVLTAKGSKDVHVITPREKGETITLVACCNAEGIFLPPVLIMKGVNRKAEFSDGLPNGSDVYMNKKSAYISTELFIRWFKDHFLPRKPKEGTTLLILDGHTSHTTALDFLDIANENNVIVMCLPSHTTQALQPLDRSFFKPLKSYYNQEANSWMLHNKDRTITRLQVGALIGRAWGRAASVGTAQSGFRACGIFPLNPNAIPDHFFAVSDLTKSSSAPPSDTRQGLTSASNAELRTSRDLFSEAITPRPSGSGVVTAALPIQASTSAITCESATSSSKETPTKILEEYSPIPKVPASVKHKPKPYILTSPINEIRKTNNPALIKGSKRQKLPIARPIDEDENNCVECWENYFATKNKSDWVKCGKCFKWLHESCSMYSPHCNDCGRAILREKNSNSKV